MTSIRPHTVSGYRCILRWMLALGLIALAGSADLALGQPFRADWATGGNQPGGPLLAAPSMVQTSQVPPVPPPQPNRPDQTLSINLATRTLPVAGSTADYCLGEGERRKGRCPTPRRQRLMAARPQFRCRLFASRRGQPGNRRERFACQLRFVLCRRWSDTQRGGDGRHFSTAGSPPGVVRSAVRLAGGAEQRALDGRRELLRGAGGPRAAWPAFSTRRPRRRCWSGRSNPWPRGWCRRSKSIGARVLLADLNQQAAAARTLGGSPAQRLARACGCAPVPWWFPWNRPVCE